MSDFTHLHVHSHYSLLDGLAKLPELLDQTKNLGMKSLALTDHGALYGLVEFSRLAEERNIRPILGLEAYLAPHGRKMRRANVDNNPRHLTLLAQDFLGYKNLVKLSTASHLEGFYYKPRIDYDLLTEHSQGIIALSGCINGDIPKAIVENRIEDAERLIKYHIDVFGKDRFYLELQDHPDLPEQKIVNDALIRYAQKFDVRIVATCDVHYTHANDDEAQDVLLCVQTRSVVSETNRMSMMGENFSLLSPDEMAERFRDNPEAIENTARIAYMCNFKLTTGTNILPSYPVPDGNTPQSYLKALCEKGLQERYPISVQPLSTGSNVSEHNSSSEHHSHETAKKAQEQLEYELSIIDKTGFASYFLIVQDFVNWSKEQGIMVGPGRGSAAGSIVSYLLNITDIDPIRYELMFERFLNPDRISMPDIDLDFADDRREEVIQYVKGKYGRDRVAQIVTFGTMAARAAIRDTGRALGLPYAMCDTIAKLIPLQSSLEDAVSSVPELQEQYKNDPQAKKLIDNAKRLEGVCRHASTHAAAVVVADRPLTEYVPLRLNDEAVVTQYAMNDVEALGLLKIDFLGLKNLTILQNTLSRIRQQYDTEINLQALPLDDKEAFGVLQRGDTTGVFQLESSGMKRYLKELKPTEFEDIVAMVSLYRPGPMDLIPEYIAGKQGRKKPSYLHPTLKPILEKTYGIAIYQEQILQIARDLAGYTLGEADILRKAMGKKISSLLARQKAKFISGAIDKGVDKKTAEKVFAFVEPFAGYGFNRCLTGDTILHDPETGKGITLEELYKKPTKLRETFSLNSSGNIYRNKITDVICNGIKPVFEVTTKTGKRIRATKNHPFLTSAGWTILEKITPKQTIAVPRHIPEPYTAQYMEQHELAVSGYMLATEHQFCVSDSYFYTTSEQELADFSDYLDNFSNTTAVIDQSEDVMTVQAEKTLNAQPSEAAEWIRLINTNKGAHFPDFVWQLSNQALAIMLGKMFSKGGRINTSCMFPHVHYVSPSPIFASELQNLLLRFGIITNIRTEYKNGKQEHVLIIDRKNSIGRFLGAFSKHFVGVNQEAVFELMMNHPILYESFYAECKKENSKQALASSESGIALNMSHIPNGSFCHLSAAHPYPSQSIFDDLKNNEKTQKTITKNAPSLDYSELNSLSNSDVYWDEIVSITPVGHAMTYDLTMDRDHNFIANGIFVHNSHAACYALIAYQTAYLKAHFPAAFMASLLTSDEGNSDRVAIEVAECEAMGITVLPPDINESDEDFTVVRDEEKDRIRFGLRAIKNVGENCIHAILETRKKESSFSDLSDFFLRVHSKDLNKKSVESLAKSGAFDSLGERNHILHNTETLLSFSRAIAAQQGSNQANLFGSLPENDARPTVRLEETKPADKRQRLMWEKELLGLFVSGHPASDLSEHLGAITTPIAEITTKMTGQQAQIGGVVTQVQNITTRKGKAMAFITIEDRTKSIEVLIFSNVLEKVKDVMQEDRIVIVQGKVNDRDGVPKVIADTMREFDPNKPEPPPNTPSAVFLCVPERAPRRTFTDLKNVLESAPNGHTRVILEVARKTVHTDRIRTSYSISFTSAIKISIQDILGPSAVRMEQSIASEAPIA